MVFLHPSKPPLTTAGKHRLHNSLRHNPRPRLPKPAPHTHHPNNRANSNPPLPPRRLFLKQRRHPSNPAPRQATRPPTNRRPSQRQALQRETIQKERRKRLRLRRAQRHHHPPQRLHRFRLVRSKLPDQRRRARVQLRGRHAR